MFIEVDSNEISSTGFTIEFEVTSGYKSKDFIERKIKEKIEDIKRIEKIKEQRKNDLIALKNQFEGIEGEF